MDASPLSKSDMEQFRSVQDQMNCTVQKISETLAVMGETLRQVADEQKRTADHDNRIAILEERQKTGQHLIDQIDLKIEHLQAAIYAERESRKADIKWILGGAMAGMVAIGGYILPHLHWK